MTPSAFSLAVGVVTVPSWASDRPAGALASAPARFSTLCTFMAHGPGGRGRMMVAARQGGCEAEGVPGVGALAYGKTSVQGDH